MTGLPDDSALQPHQLAKIRAEARRALANANALGHLPTPVDQVIAAAKIEVAPPLELDEGFLARLHHRAKDAVRRALSKVVGVIDIAARLIHLDKTAPKHRLPFLKVHELGHGWLGWHRDAYGLVEDCEKTIDPETSEEFEREANVFASEVLFQLDLFTDHAADFTLGLRAPLSLQRKFGTSAYSTIRRYVSTHHRACAVVVFEPPTLEAGVGFRAVFRRAISSTTFAAMFGRMPWPQEVTAGHRWGRLIPVHSKMSRPQTCVVTDLNGTDHECVGEGFATPYHVFLLLYPTVALTKKVVLVAR